MIKFGDINIIGVFYGDIPITSAFKGEDLVYSSKPKYPENLLIFQYWLKESNEVHLPIYYLGVCDIDWGDGQINRDRNTSGEDITHTYNPAYYNGLINVIVTIKLQPTAADYGILCGYIASYNNLVSIVTTPKLYPFNIYSCQEIKASGSLYPQYQPNLGLIENDSTTDDWVLFVVNNLGGYALNNELTVGSFKNANGLVVGAMGEYKKITFKPNFKLKDDASGNHITLYEHCKVNEIVGNIDFSNCMEVSSDFLLLYNKDYIHKIGIIKLANVPADKTVWKIDTKNTILNNLVNFEIANLGQYVNQGMTYDFTGLDAWGDENKAATLGVTGARQSLLDTLVNNSYDVNGKDVTLKLPKSVKDRLSAQAIAAIEAKGYIVPLYEDNELVFLVTTTKPNEVWSPQSNQLSYVDKIDYGDGTIELNTGIDKNHIYKEPGKYTYTITNYLFPADITLTHFGNMTKVLNIPNNTNLRLDPSSVTKCHINELNNPRLVITNDIFNSVGITDELIFGQFRRPSSMGFRTTGTYKKVIFKPNFNGKGFLFQTDSTAIITELLGNMDFSQNADIQINQNVLKIDKYLMRKPTTNNWKVIEPYYYVTEPLKLTYLHIGNLGNQVTNNTTYDFSNLSKWGDDAFAESVGITGAKQSLIDTINDALDVTGKNVTIKFSSETLSRLSDEELKPLWDKGYIIEGRENPFKPIITWEPNTHVINNKYSEELFGGQERTLFVKLKNVHSFTITTCLSGTRLGSQRDEYIKSYIDGVLLTSVIDPYTNTEHCDSKKYTILDNLEHTIKIVINYGRFVNTKITASALISKIS